MRMPLILPGLFLVAAVAWACGDKLMLVMGARSARIKPVRPALILAYPGQNASATLIRDLQLQPAVKKAGHRIQVVEDPAGLENALKGGKYDLVIADVANANELEPACLVGAVETGGLAGRLPGVERGTVRRPKEVPLPFEGSRQP